MFADNEEVDAAASDIASEADPGKCEFSVRACSLKTTISFGVIS